MPVLRPSHSLVVADARVALSGVVDFGSGLACLDDVVLDGAGSGVGAGSIVREATGRVARMANMLHVELVLAGLRRVRDDMILVHVESWLTEDLTTCDL